MKTAESAAIFRIDKLEFAIFDEFKQRVSTSEWHRVEFRLKFGFNNGRIGPEEKRETPKPSQS